MNIEWSESKRRRNLNKHGFDFTDAPIIFADDIVTVEDDRWEYGETRFISIGLLNGRAVVIVHTETDQVIHLISMRKATNYEERTYFQSIGH